MLYILLSRSLEQRRKTQPPYPQDIQNFQSKEETTPYQDLNRYRVNPQLRLLIGPIMDPPVDRILASDITELVPIEEKEVAIENKDILKDESNKELKTVLLDNSMQSESKKNITITDRLKVSFDHCYLVKQNGELVGYCDDHQTALSILNRIANAEVKKREKPKVKVFRRELKDGMEIQICTQTVGLWNGKIVKDLVLTAFPIPYGVYV